MRGEELPLSEALVRLMALRKQGKNPYLEFKCESCKRLNRIPQKAEAKTTIVCGKCGETNYLKIFKVISN